MFREAGELLAIGYALLGLADATCALGEYQASRQYFHKALKTVTQTHATQFILDALVGVSILLTEGEQRGNVFPSKAKEWSPFASDTF